jgi:hypothetical protein
MNTSAIRRHDHDRPTRTGATFTTLLLQVSIRLTASRQRSAGSYSLRHKGAALASQLLTNDPTKRQQLYSPSRKCTTAYCCHVESFNCIATTFRAGATGLSGFDSRRKQTPCTGLRRGSTVSSPKRTNSSFPMVTDLISRLILVAILLH